MEEEEVEEEEEIAAIRRGGPSGSRSGHPTPPPQMGTPVPPALMIPHDYMMHQHFMMQANFLQQQACFCHQVVLQKTFLPASICVT